MKQAAYKLIRNRYGYWPSYWDEKEERYRNFRQNGNYVFFLLDQKAEAQMWLADAKENQAKIEK